MADIQEVACLKRLLDDTGAAGALFCTLLFITVLLPPPPLGLLGLPLKLLRGQPHVSHNEAALVNPMHKLELTVGQGT